VQTLESIKPRNLSLSLTVNDSLFLVRFYAASYFIFAISIWLATIPLMKINSFWFFFLLLLSIIMCLLFRQQKTRLFSGKLWINESQWLLQSNTMTSAAKVDLVGEVLCWNWLIILNFKQLNSTNTHFVLLANDSLSQEDNAKLRAWLRIKY
jgi:hypothetical protein